MSNAILMQGFVAGVFTATLSAASHAVPDVGLPFHDLYVGVGVGPGPEVVEHTSSAAGTTGYDWDGVKKSGLALSVMSLNGRGYRTGGFVWGGELALGLYDIRPESFTVDGATYRNGSNEKLTHRTLGVNVLAGYEYGIVKQDGLRGYVMILPHVGGGLATAENEVRTGSVYDKERGTGHYGEYGIRLGGFLTESDWLFGALVGYVRSSAKVDISISGYDSELRLKRSGAAFQVLAGYRF